MKSHVYTSKAKYYNDFDIQYFQYLNFFLSRFINVVISLVHNPSLLTLISIEIWFKKENVIIFSKKDLFYGGLNKPFNVLYTNVFMAQICNAFCSCSFNIIFTNKKFNWNKTNRLTLITHKHFFPVLKWQQTEPERIKSKYAFVIIFAVTCRLNLTNSMCYDKSMCGEIKCWQVLSLMCTLFTFALQAKLNRMQESEHNNLKTTTRATGE